MKCRMIVGTGLGILDKASGVVPAGTVINRVHVKREFIPRSKYTPHQGAAEKDRRVRQGVAA